MIVCPPHFCFFFFNDTATTEIYTLSLHDALPISRGCVPVAGRHRVRRRSPVLTRIRRRVRSEEHTSELQSRLHLVCRLLLEKKKNNQTAHIHNCNATVRWSSEMRRACCKQHSLCS